MPPNKPGQPSPRGQGLFERLQNQLSDIALSRADLGTLKMAYSSLKKFKVSLSDALIADWFGAFCKDRKYKRYAKGREQIENRLDIVKLINASLHLEVLRKFYLLPH